MLELQQTFTFDTDADKVLEFIMGEQDKRRIEMTDSVTVFIGHLSFSATPQEGFVGVIRASMCDGASAVFLDQSPQWYIWDKPVAQIRLLQNKPGECEGQLLVETNRGSWFDGDWDLPLSVGSQLLSLFWRELVESWAKRQGVDHTGGEKIAGEHPRNLDND